MTAQELKDRTELNMDDAKLAETQAKVAEMLHADPARVAEFLHAEAINGAQLGNPYPKPRKARSDKGVPKPKKAQEQKPGVLTEQQIATIKTLTQAVHDAREAFAQAEDDLRDAQSTFDRYLESLAKY